MVMLFKKTGCFSLVLLLLSPPLYCKNLGVLGAVFGIKEKDLIETIQQKLSLMNASGAIAYHQNQLLEKAEGVLQTPHPVSNLTETVNPRTFHWNPSITFPMDIKNHQNQLIYKKGTRLNPLESVAFKGQWLFFNGEDDKQKAWAKSAYKLGDKLILVRGSPLQLMHSWQLPVYFDQQGLLTRKIGIQQIPARISQDGQVLKVEEIRLAEEPS
jgi:conjugal transfer pilus assembly protein TraW